MNQPQQTKRTGAYSMNEQENIPFLDDSVNWDNIIFQEQYGDSSHYSNVQYEESLHSRKLIKNPTIMLKEI